MSNKHFFFLVLLIFAGAFYVRYVDLATHFFVINDPSWFRFLFSTEWLKPEMEYRNLLYWARWPSLLFSCVTLVLFFGYLSFYYQDVFYTHVPLYQALLALGTVMVAFSWEHVIYAKDIGVTSAGPFFLVLFLFQLYHASRQDRISWKILFLHFSLVFVGCLVQAELLLFVPGLMLALSSLVFRPLFANHEKIRASVLLTVFFFLFSAAYIFASRALYPQGRAAVVGEVGPNKMFLLNLGQYNGFFEKAGQVIEFFPLNLGRLIGTHLSYTFEDTPLNYFFWSVCFFFLLFGFFKIWSESRDSVRRSLALFVSLTVFLGICFVFSGRMALSPTRHYLILLPLMVLLVLEGVYLVVQVLWVARVWSTRGLIPSVFALLICISFAISFPQMMGERQDPFDENALIQLFKEHEVSLVYQPPQMLNVNFMSKLKTQLSVISGLPTTESRSEKLRMPNIDQIAFFTQEQGLSSGAFDLFVKRFNENPNHPMLKASLSDYDVIHHFAKDGTAMDYSKYSQGEVNRLQVFILKRKEFSDARLEMPYDRL
ncbi:MAG: hypothetical protein AB7F59_08860 [Bdellovibrionales bacterium]